MRPFSLERLRITTVEAATRVIVRQQLRNPNHTFPESALFESSGKKKIQDNQKQCGDKRRAHTPPESLKWSPIWY